MKKKYILLIITILVVGCVNDVQEVTENNYYGSDPYGKGYTFFVLDSSQNSISKVDMESNLIIDPYIELTEDADKLFLKGDYLYTISTDTAIVQKISILNKQINNLWLLTTTMHT